MLKKRGEEDDKKKMGNIIENIRPYKNLIT